MKQTKNQNRQTQKCLTTTIAIKYKRNANLIPTAAVLTHKSQPATKKRVNTSIKWFDELNEIKRDKKREKNRNGVK